MKKRTIKTRDVRDEVIKESAKAFTCRGCGIEKKPDGTPQNAAFVWTNVKTKKPLSYCYDCDDKLIQGVPLPNEGAS